MVSSHVEGPRLVRVSEFDDMLALLDRCFGGDTAIEERNPNAYRRTHRQRHAVITVDGEVVSHAACVPQRLAIGSEGVACHGIGGVATDESHRGKGYMSQLLSFWLDRLDDAEVPLVELGGDRQRYRRFGWENASRMLVYSVTDRSFDGPRERDPGPLERYRVTDDQLDIALALHDDRSPRLVRSRQLHDALLSRPDVETLLWRTAGDESYLVVTADSGSRNVLEFGGDPAGFESLLGTVMADPDTDDLRVYGHATDSLLRHCRPHAAGWSVQPNRKQLICDLRGTLAGFEPQLSARWQHIDGGNALPLRLAIDGSDIVELGFDADGVTVEPADGPTDIVRSRADMADLLFGFPDVHRSVDVAHPALPVLFPLAFYVSPLESF